MGHIKIIERIAEKITKGLYKVMKRRVQKEKYWRPTVYRLMIAVRYSESHRSVFIYKS